MLVSNDTTSRNKRTFHVGMALTTLIIVLWGFGPTYFLRVLRGASIDAAQTPAPPVSAIVHVHAIAFTLWILLFVGQTALVAAGRTKAHRQLGTAAAALAGLMVILGVLTTIQGARDNWNPTPLPDSLAFMTFGFFDILLFAIFVGAGIYFRRNKELHKRLMLLGTIGGLMWPAITRMQYISPRVDLMFGVLVLMLIALPLHDLWKNRRIHPLSILGGLLILLSFPLRLAIAVTETWHSFAAWLVR